MKLLIVGSVAIDSVETPFGKADNALGGSATYASVAASYFTSPGIVAVVGYDFDRRYINLLMRKGIDLEGLQIDSSGKTFFWSGYYEGDMNAAHTRVTDLNVFESFNPAIPKSYRETPFILLENIHPALQLEVLSQIHSPKLVMCDTMNYWINSEPELLEKVFRKVDVICINEDEARLFCGTSSLPAAANQLLKLGPRYVIINKKGYTWGGAVRQEEFFRPAQHAAYEGERPHRGRGYIRRWDHRIYSEIEPAERGCVKTRAGGRHGDGVVLRGGFQLPPDRKIEAGRDIRKSETP
jgi:hypothetical protein